MFDAVFSGAPLPPYPAGAKTVASGVDTSTGAVWNTAQGSGWAPVSPAIGRQIQLALSGEPTNYVFTVPVTGLYRVSAYEISTVATSGTLPSISAAYTDANTAGAATSQVVGSASSAAANVTNSGSTLVNVAAGGTITLSGASYASTTYNVKFRVEYLG